MPKERFHLYLADRVVHRCASSLSSGILRQCITGPESLTFYIGSISPDIFFYDLPFFSLSPLGDALHDLMDRKGISIIFDWMVSNREKSLEAGGVLWGLGLASHFLADAAWHPVIEELSRHGLQIEAESGGQREKHDAGGGLRAKGETGLLPPRCFSASVFFNSPFPGSRFCVSGIVCHRLLESEIEAFRLAGSLDPSKYDALLKAFGTDKRRLHKIASYYRRFLEFAGLPPQVGPRDRACRRVERLSTPDTEVFERRIVRCFLLQRFLLRLFANKLLGRQRDLLLSISPFLGSLVTPGRPILPGPFSGAFPDCRNPFSDCFLEQSFAYLELHFCGLTEKLSQIPAP
jgi:hypothetical protein